MTIMNKKIMTLVLAGIFALGGTLAAYAGSNNTSSAGSVNSSKNTVTTQSKVPNDQSKEAEEKDAAVTLPAGGISQADAEKIALGSLPGGTVVTSELEDENGVIVYGVEIKSANTVNDVKVDATTGAIVKTDQDKDKNEQSSNEEESNDSDNGNIQHENQNEDPDGYEN